MKRSIITLECKSFDNNTKRRTPFRVIKYSFDYLTSTEDKLFLDQMYSEGVYLANKVNPGAANNAAEKRSYEKILNNCVAGVLSEYLWMNFLNHQNILVESTRFESAANQIDLKIISNNKKIEVRSSFPRNGIKFAICSSTHEFDVIGMYSNGYKPSEIQKDYYVRALFHLKVIENWQKDADTSIPIIEKLIDKMHQDNFAVFLTGGATWTMMIDDNVAINKDFVPEDETDIQKLKDKTTYRVVPFSKALDSMDLFELIKADL
jgi:hypothetical protein